MAGIVELLAPHTRDLGGFSVRRLLPAFRRQTVGPFIFFDHMGPASFAPGEGIDVRPHPHIGLATVTYLFEGALLHRDSLGNVQRIAPGDVNWMTAGRGIVHSERTAPEDRRLGLPMNGLQTWVALPRAHEMAEPAFSHHPAATLPVVERPGARVVVVAGRLLGETAPAPTLSDTLYAAVELKAGATFTIPPEHVERGVYAVAGDVTVAGQPLPAGHFAVLPAGDPIGVTAQSGARVMLVGGAPLDGDRFIWWNFVASTRERIEEAAADWAADRFARVPGETEFIPLPERRQA